MHLEKIRAALGDNEIDMQSACSLQSQLAACLPSVNPALLAELHGVLVTVRQLDMIT